jgi:hypothetical protein
MPAVMMAQFASDGGSCLDIGRRQLPSRFFKATLIAGAVDDVRGPPATSKTGLAGNDDRCRNRCERQNGLQWPLHMTGIPVWFFGMRSIVDESAEVHL